MADNQEKSDDLIAELAKLMASNAQGGESEAKPSVIKLTPLSEAVPSPSPVRIPGMDAAKPATPAVPTAGTVRIPGMNSPLASTAPAVDAAPPQNAPVTPPEAVAPTVATPTAATPAAAAPATPTSAPAAPDSEDAPTANTAGAGTLGAPRVEAGLVVPPPAPQARPASPLSSAAPKPATEPEPKVDAGDAKPQAPADAADASKPDTGSDDGFDFDFGFGAQAAAAETKDEDASTPDHDAIADLITAELGAADTSSTSAAAGAAPPYNPAPASMFRQPASVQAVPARNFGNNVVQAPVLIGRPGGAGPAASDKSDQESPPRQPAGGDKFAVAPVFGLGSGTPAAAPAPERHGSGDPMDEIENLIGEAVRVQLSGSGETESRPQERQPAAPVVPPLNTGFAPRRAGLKDVDQKAQSAEAAILAAAAATGAEVGRIQAPVAEERPYRRTSVKPPNTSLLSGNMRQYLGMGVAAVLLLAAGLGLYWVLGMGRADPESAPVLTADATPVKQPPAAASVETAEAPRSVVFDEIAGTAPTGDAETLVSRDETAGASVTDVARAVIPENTESGLANRKVRTVTVRPDGTIVSGDEAVAGTEALPVERPNVPELPGGTEQPSELLASVAAASAGTSGATAAAESPETDDPIAALVAGSNTEATPAPTELAALAPVTTETADAPAVFDGSLVAPVPMPRPTDRSALASAQQSASASAVAPRDPASLPLVSLTNDAPAAPAASAASAAAYVQLASLPSEAEARNTANSMQSRWGNLFGGSGLVVQRAQLGDGRVTYRVRLPASSLQGATQVCASIKANGGDCFATNG